MISFDCSDSTLKIGAIGQTVVADQLVTCLTYQTLHRSWAWDRLINDLSEKDTETRSRCCFPGTKRLVMPHSLFATGRGLLS